ncbi:MAG: phenylalanine--tRNA ligase subunit beta, partial [Candidatus Altiarchaeales archaeon]|nr:phenylalanine--tRNA ligase subunit beta [Candidatus Altiarchaeales archaeon]
MKQPQLSPTKLSLERDYVNRLLGLELDSTEIQNLLKRMGFGVTEGGETLSVSVPPFRCDVLHPIDLVEDIAIAYGYMNFKPQEPRIYAVGEDDDLERYSDLSRTLLIGFGFTEVVNLILTSSHNLYGKMNLE